MSRTRKYSDETLITALKATKGMVYLAARKIGANVNVFYRRAKVSPAIAEAIETTRGETTDRVEMKLLKLINEGNVAAIIFYLKTIGKSRGYVERTELTGVEGGPVEIIFNWGHDDSQPDTE